MSNQRAGRSRVAVMGAATLLGALALGGCGADSIAEEASEQAAEEAVGGDADVEVDSETGGMKIESEEGSLSTGEDVELPESFPDDLPLPSADYTVPFALDGAEQLQVTLVVPGAEPETLDEEIEQGIADGGYAVDGRTESRMGETLRSLSFIARGNGRDVYVGLTHDLGTDESTLTYRIEPEGSM